MVVFVCSCGFLGRGNSLWGFVRFFTSFCLLFGTIHLKTGKARLDGKSEKFRGYSCQLIVRRATRNLSGPAVNKWGPAHLTYGTVSTSLTGAVAAEPFSLFPLHITTRGRVLAGQVLYSIHPPSSHLDPLPVPVASTKCNLLPRTVQHSAPCGGSRERIHAFH